MAKAYDKNTNIDLTLDLFKNYLSRKGGEELIKEVTKNNINVKECSKKKKKKKWCHSLKNVISALNNYIISSKELTNSIISPI